MRKSDNESAYKSGRKPDSLQRFLIESCDVRGQLVHLDATWCDATARTEYPPRVKKVLGEAFVAASLLASTVKFNGKMTLQVRGTGPVHLLVVQITRDGDMRGLARWKEEPASDDLQSQFGADARMIISIEAEEKGEPYQGIVPLEGERLSESLKHYFATSEQLSTELVLAVSDSTAAGILIQKLPASEQLSKDVDGWQRASMLTATVEESELCELEATKLLHRLYHEEQVRVFDQEHVRFHCACSRERTSNMLLSLGLEEVQSILDEQGEVEVICEFCDAEYRYDAVDVTGLFKGSLGEGDNSTKH